LPGKRPQHARRRSERHPSAVQCDAARPLAQYRCSTARGSRGFTYLALLIGVALMGIMLAGAATLWSLSAQRDKEAELLFIGHQFRHAIARYYAAGGAGFQYPRDLQDLVEDPRSAVPRRFLRRVYLDPMTGANDWTLLLTNDGGIIGVASSSTAKTIKRANFRGEDSVFEGSESYRDWQFIYHPGRGKPVRRPAPSAVAPLR
jgi:type II secretory pathway pseudopilin PulG